jgi:hypothetical protein
MRSRHCGGPKEGGTMQRSGVGSTNNPDARPVPLALFQSLLPFTKCVNVPALASAAAGATTPAQLVEFQQDGLVIGMRCCATAWSAVDALGASRPMSSLGIRIAVNDNENELSTDGQGTVFTPFANLVGFNGDNPAMLMRWVKAHQKWSVSVKNSDSANTYTPAVTFYFMDRAQAKAFRIPEPRGAFAAEG